jgi:DNA-binding transcriptional LysR family regulator
MDINQLQTFVAVAREGTILRASELLHLSPPVVSAHIKAVEDTVGLTLFERTSRGVSLTRDGLRLVTRAEHTLASHRELMGEITRIKGRLAGKLRLGAGGNSSQEAIAKLLSVLAQRHPEVDVVVRHGTSLDILAGIRSGSLDAGFYNEAAEPEPELSTREVARFGIYVAAARGLLPAADMPDWKSIAELPWIYPTSSACCGRAAESLFEAHRIRPQRIISVDREDVTKALIARRVGVGLLHAGAAHEAKGRGEVDLLCQAETSVRVLFAHLASRAQEPVLAAASSIVRA